MDLQFGTEQVFVGEDHSWVKNRLGFDTARTITLDLSRFTAAMHYPDGFIPSGVVVAKLGSSLYGPYNNADGAAADEQQTLTRTSTGGTITLSFDPPGVAASETTGTIPASAAGFTAAAVQAALDALDAFDPGDVVVTGAAGGPLTLTYGGQYDSENVPQVVVDNALATGGTIVAATTVPGVGGAGLAAGHLLNSVPVRVGNEEGVAVSALLWQGIVKVPRLPSGNGLDSAAQADLIHIRYES